MNSLQSPPAYASPTETEPETGETEVRFVKSQEQLRRLEPAVVRLNLEKLLPLEEQASPTHKFCNACAIRFAELTAVQHLTAAEALQRIFPTEEEQVARDLHLLNCFEPGGLAIAKVYQEYKVFEDLVARLQQNLET